MENKDQPRQIRLISLLFFCFVFSVYLLTYQGVPVSDDEQLFASAAQTLAVHGELDAPQLYGNQRLQGNYQGSGALHPILAAPVIALARLASLGQLQVAYFLSSLYTALTAALLVYHILKSGYRLRTGLIAGILFSLGTIAWPYSQTFYREPLAMLLLTLSWLCFTTALSQDASRRKKVLAWAAFGVIFGAALMTKVLLIVVLPAFLVILWRTWSVDVPELSSSKWRNAAYITAAVVLGVVVLWVMNSLKILNVTPRLTLRFFERLWRFRGEYPYDQIPGALLGMLFSPIKGLLVYSPGVLLALIPVAKYTLQEKRRTLFAFLALLGLLISQATAYGAEWWNTTWGTRFLLPIFPFLILAGLPVIEKTLTSEKRWHKNALWGLVVLSIVIQIGGVLISMATYAADLYLEKGIPDMGLTIWQIQHAPLIENWRLLFSGQGPDLAAWQVFRYAPTLITLSIMLCLAIAAASLLLIRRFSHYQKKIRAKGLLILLPLIAILLIPFLMLTAYQHDPQYAAWRFDIQVARDHLTENAKKGDVILIYPYLRENWYYFINFYQGEIPWYSLPTTFPAGDEEAGLSLIRSLNETYDRVWLLSDTGLDEPMNTSAFYALTQYGLFLDDRAWQHEDYPRQLRLTLFELWE